jgi:branched-chain amino acid transport system ATP-binding protein
MIALKYASYGFVIENGRTVLEGTSEELTSNQDIQKFYLGVAAGEA